MIRAWFVLIAIMIFTFAFVTPEPVDARSRGGSLGSIRNSGSSSRHSVPRSAPIKRPPVDRSQTQNRQQLTPPTDTAARQEAWQSKTPEQQQAAKEKLQSTEGQNREKSLEDRQDLEERYENLTPEEQEQVKDRWDELSEEEQQQFEDRYEQRQENLDDRLEYREEAREDWQEWHEDQYDDYWDDHWHSHWWYGGYHHSSISVTYYVNDSPPCNTMIVHSDGYTYYHCDTTWHQATYYQGETQYVLVSAPPGVEITSLDDYEIIAVGGQDYYLNNHTFYQLITRDNRDVYVVVDPPYDAIIKVLPEYAVKVEVSSQTYYRWDKTYYQESTSVTGSYVVVRAPS